MLYLGFNPSEMSAPERLVPKGEVDVSTLKNLVQEGKVTPRVFEKDTPEIERLNSDYALSIPVSPFRLKYLKRGDGYIKIEHAHEMGRYRFLLFEKK